MCVCVCVCVCMCVCVCVCVCVCGPAFGPKDCEVREGETQNVSKLKTHFCPVCVCVVLLGYLGLSVD